MSNNPPPYGPPPGAGQPYGPPPGSGQPYGPPPGQPGFPGGPQPAYGTPYGAPGYGVPQGGPTKKWYQRWWVWLVAVIAVIIIVVVVVAVIFGGKYALESKIKEVLKDQGFTVSDVNCPNNIDTDKGNEYNCTAVINGQERSLHVRFDADRHFILTSN